MTIFKHLISPAVAIILALTTLSPAARSQDDKQVSCTYSGNAWLETRLYMGLSKPGGAAVSKREWDEFVSNNLWIQPTAATHSANFSAGFDIARSCGAFRSAAAQSRLAWPVSEQINRFRVAM